MVRRALEGDYKVNCPLCKAPAGLPCRSTGGHGPIAGGVHRERRRAAEEMLASVRQAEAAVREARRGV